MTFIRVPAARSYYTNFFWKTNQNYALIITIPSNIVKVSQFFEFHFFDTSLSNTVKVVLFIFAVNVSRKRAVPLISATIEIAQPRTDG